MAAALAPVGRTTSAPPAPPLQVDLTACRLRFDLRAQTAIALGPQPGQQLRGALVEALRRHYCLDPTQRAATHAEACPVCWLLSREDPSWWRGNTPVRPYTIEPPHLPAARTPPVLEVPAGACLSFGVTVFGRALQLLPHLVSAVAAVGATGLGRRGPRGEGGRGRFLVERVLAVHPLRHETQTLWWEGGSCFTPPSLFITGADVLQAAQALAARRHPCLTLEFATVTRIVSQGRLQRTPDFGPFFRRLLERVEGLAREYGTLAPGAALPALAAADAVQLIQDDTRWVDGMSYSSRLGRATPAGGFLGRATYQADDWAPLLPWLLWGSVAHVGKNVVKGGGHYSLIFAGAAPWP